MARYLIMGPPGAGKGTHATNIADRFGVPAISTGAMFRAEIASGSELGKQVDALVQSGALVPDELTDKVLASRLAQPDAAGGWLLDGYPRTMEQVETLDKMLAAQGAKLDGVLMLDVPRDEVIRRLMKRSTIEGRADDTPDVVGHRQMVYEAQTAPVVDEYERRGLVVHIDASGSIEESATNVSHALDAQEALHAK